MSYVDYIEGEIMYEQAMMRQSVEDCITGMDPLRLLQESREALQATADDYQSMPERERKFIQMARSVQMKGIAYQSLSDKQRMVLGWAIFHYHPKGITR
jgi:hypothetical protein